MATQQQYALRRAAYRIGQAFGTGGTAWTYVAPSGDGVSAAVTLVNEGLRSLYVVRNFLNKAQVAQAGTTVFMADWLGIGAADLDVAPQGVLISARDEDIAFSVIGKPETDQGFALIPLAPAASPLRRMAPRRLLRQGAAMGQRAGM